MSCIASCTSLCRHSPITCHPSSCADQSVKDPDSNLVDIRLQGAIHAIGSIHGRHLPVHNSRHSWPVGVACLSARSSCEQAAHPADACLTLCKDHSLLWYTTQKVYEVHRPLGLQFASQAHQSSCSCSHHVMVGGASGAAPPAAEQEDDVVDLLDSDEEEDAPQESAAGSDELQASSSAEASQASCYPCDGCLSSSERSCRCALTASWRQPLQCNSLQCRACCMHMTLLIFDPLCLCLWCMWWLYGQSLHILTI